MRLHPISIPRDVPLGGPSPQLINETLKRELAALKARHERGQRLFRFMGATAPSARLVGTTVGLVHTGADRGRDEWEPRAHPLEQSNFDLADQFVKRIVSQCAFQANTTTVSVASELTANLVDRGQ